MFFGLLWFLALITKRLAYSDGFGVLTFGAFELFVELMIFATWLN
jgi:hypothetical protein